MPRGAAKPVQKTAAKAAAAKPDVASKPAVAKPQPKPEPVRHYEIAEAQQKKSVFSKPLGVVFLPLGMALFVAGAYFLGKIQFAGGDVKKFLPGFGLFTLGVVLMCVPCYEFFIPRKTFDELDLVQIEKGKKSN